MAIDRDRLESLRNADEASQGARVDAILARFDATRARTEALVEPLSDEDQLLQSMFSCSPAKWHRAHTTWFFEQLVIGRLEEPTFSVLFNSYYEAFGPRVARGQRGLLSRPSVQEVTRYRARVEAQVHERLRNASPSVLERLLPIMALGIAHEEQHQELLLTDLLHAFSQHPLRPAYRAPAQRRERADAPSAKLRFFDHEGGFVSIGADGTSFAFDHEGPRHRVYLEPFALASRLVTVEELRAFLDSRAYETPSLWLSEGFDLVQARGLTAPHGYRKEGGAIVSFGLDGEREAAPSDPLVHLTYFEADALARFLGARLPTEAEWEVFAARADETEGNDLSSGALRPLPARAAGDGPGQLFGDAWEWTASAYGPYPGYRPPAGALAEYNGKFMSSQFILRGGSCFTPRGHAHAHTRNYWPPATSFQLTGLRLARSR